MPGGKGGDALAAWAARSGRPQTRGPVRGGLRFVFYGRVSTEDWQDPVTSRARQREQAEALVRGHGVIVAEFFDAGQSRMVAWGRRPEAAALVALLADPGRGWDAIVIGEYERAFYGASTRRWRRCSSITASSCGCRRRAAGSTTHPSMMSRR
jgi:site-specific DNA recombinase